MSRGNFAAGVHQTAVADRSQHCGERKFMAEHASLQVTIRDGDRTARTKQHIAKCPAVFPERDFAIGAAIQIIEHRPRQSTLRHAAQIFDIDDL